MKIMPFRATTRTGETFDVEFPLHRETGDAVQVWNLVNDVLKAIDRSLLPGGPTSNGDVLQAVAMAMAIRARAIHASPETTARLARELLETALDAVAEATHHTQTAGHA